MILFFDTETTGLADMKRRPDAHGQPRLVQLAMLLTDEAGVERGSASFLIQPEGFEIPISASGLHGKTTELAIRFGVELVTALKLFRELWNSADLIVGHNVDFDLFIMDGEFFREAGGIKAWGNVKDTFCTMQAMTPICKLPGKYSDFKWPKLQEARKYAFGSEFDGAHDALADVRACAEVYLWLKNQPKLNGVGP